MGVTVKTGIKRKKTFLIVFCTIYFFLFFFTQKSKTYMFRTLTDIKVLHVLIFFVPNPVSVESIS